jgi:predicted  nucleic acid-binding Zn-ribbon protein
MGTDPPAMGKGLFGYRKSAVNQMLSDRDVMLRQAEGRVRAAESKVAQLEGELTSMRDRNVRMEEQLERLRVQLNALAAGTVSVAVASPPATEVPPQTQPIPDQQPAPPEPHLYPEATSYPDAAVEGPLPRYWEPSQEIPFEKPSATPEPPPTPAPTMETTPEPEAWYPEETSGEPDVWHTEETAAPSPATETPQPDSPWEPAETEDAVHGAVSPPPVGSTPHVGAWDYPPGYDADAFGYHGPVYPEPESAPGQPESTPMPEADAGSTVAEEEPALGAESWEAPSMEGAAVHPEPQGPRFEDHESPEPVFPDRKAEAAAPPPAASRPAEAASRFVTEELAGILTAAEESASRIIERARESSERQIERSTRLWNEVQTEVSRFAAWREEVEPVIRTVQAKVENVRTFIEEVPERIREALAPMAESISSIDSDLADLSAACNPPLLLTPSELEPGDERRDAPEQRPHRSEPSRDRVNEDPFGFGRSAS